MAGDPALALAPTQTPADVATQVEATPPTVVGRDFAGRYRIERELGCGGMGTVYGGVELATGRAVAVKVLHAALTQDRVVSQRFDREIAVARQLSHLNCVPVIDAGTSPEGLRYLVMPLLVGTELRAMMTGPLAIDLVIDVALQTLAGLGHLHARGFVHRDVKPENLFIVRDGHGAPIVKLVDFGLVKLLAEQTGRPLTRVGMVFGTPAYMSPEQAGGEEVDARADQYAVGITMYEMLTGEPPFTAETLSLLLYRHIFSEAEPLPATVPAPLRAFVERLLKKNPADRFASAAVAEATLREIAAALGVLRQPAPASRPRAHHHASAPRRVLPRLPSVPEAAPVSLLRSTGVPRWLSALVVVLLLAIGGTSLARAYGTELSSEAIAVHDPAVAQVKETEIAAVTEIPVVASDEVRGGAVVLPVSAEPAPAPTPAPIVVAPVAPVPAPASSVVVPDEPATVEPTSSEPAPEPAPASIEPAPSKPSVKPTKPKVHRPAPSQPSTKPTPLPPPPTNDHVVHLVSTRPPRAVPVATPTTKLPKRPPVATPSHGGPKVQGHRA